MRRKEQKAESMVDLLARFWTVVCDPFDGVNVSKKVLKDVGADSGRVNLVGCVNNLIIRVVAIFVVPYFTLIPPHQCVFLFCFFAYFSSLLLIFFKDKNNASRVSMIVRPCIYLFSGPTIPHTRVRHRLFLPWRCIQQVYGHYVFLVDLRMH